MINLLGCRTLVAAAPGRPRSQTRGPIMYGCENIRLCGISGYERLVPNVGRIGQHLPALTQPATERIRRISETGSGRDKGESQGAKRNQRHRDHRVNVSGVGQCITLRQTIERYSLPSKSEQMPNAKRMYRLKAPPFEKSPRASRRCRRLVNRSYGRRIFLTVFRDLCL
jgi:hypothetical protein